MASIKFDNNLNDDANQGHPLIGHGNYSYVEGVLPGTKALHVESGNGNYVGTTQSLNVGNDSFTTSFWYKGDTKDNQVILSNKDFGKSSNAGWAIYTSPNSVNMNLGFPAASVKFGRDTFNASAWRYVTFVVDRDKMLGSLYIDGYEMAETSLGIGTLDTSNPLNIGSDGVGGNGGNSFDIADLKVWSGALSSDAVQSSYNGYGLNKVDMNALNDNISEANTFIAGGLGEGFSQTDFDYLKNVFNMATSVVTTQKVKLYTQETINYYERELNNAIFIYQKSNKTLTPADLNIADSSDPEYNGDTVNTRQEEDIRKDLQVFPQADVIVQPGDITGGNNANEYVWMDSFKTVYNKLKAEGLFKTTKLYVVKGNHDMGGSEAFVPDGTAGAWNESTQSYNNDFSNSAYRVKIKGYNLIGFDANVNNSNTVGKATNFLNEIKSEADYDPKKPIIAMSHYPIGGTVWSSAWSSAASNNFGKFIADNNFSQVFYMSGHTQYDPTDERSLYQGAATYLDSGGSNYSSYQDDGPFGGYIEGSYGSYHTTPRISNFIEVYGTKLIIKQYNLATDEFVSIPRVVNVGEGKDAFNYSKRDTRELVAPQFDEGIKIDSLNANEVAFTMKQANDNVRGMEYNIQLINKLTGKVDKSFNSLSYPLDKPYDVYRQYKFTNLSPGTPYKIRVFADDSMYNRSSQDIEINVNSVNLNSITTPASVSANNGTAKTAEALGLPIKVILATDGGSVDASVNWDLSGISYDPSIKTVQTFSVPGTVTLPLGVENPNSVPLTTSINVTVKEVGAASDYLTLDKSQYIQGEAITLSYNGAALNGKDWVGIYKTGAVPPGAGVSLLWSYLKSGSGRVSLNSGLAPGTYDALFMLNDGYTIVDRKTFQVVQRVPVSGVTLDQQNVTMTQGETRTLTAAVLPANANDTRVSWISSDPTVVSINSTGSGASLIGNRPGTATVTVKTLDGNFTASANVTVNPAMPQSTLSGLQQVAPGQTFDVMMGLSNVTQSVYQQVYGQDLTLHYDPVTLQFNSVTSLKEGFQVIDQNETVPGQVRIVAASVGSKVDAQGDMLSFQFTAKSVTQATNMTTISVDNVVFANGQGNEQQVGGASHEIQIAIPSIPVDKSILNALIADAQAKYNAAEEGNGNGLYVIGAKAQLQSAIDAANMTAKDPNATQQQVDSAKVALEAAIQVFETKRINADINGGGVSIGDLAIVASAYGKQQDQAGWDARADVNHDGKVNIVDLAIVAKAILN